MEREQPAGFFNWCEERSLRNPTEITRPILERYQRWLFYYRTKQGRPLTIASQHKRLAAVLAFFKWMAKANMILFNPASEIDLPLAALPGRIASTTMVLAQQEAAKEKVPTGNARRCASTRPRPRCCRFENARLGLATNFRRLAPRRYADDLVIGFELREDAEKVMAMLHQRMAEYGLRLHPEKTRLVPFERPPRRQDGGKGPGSFDFLGFTLFWRRTRKGNWGQNFRTRKARLQRAKVALNDCCRRHRHEPVKEQHASLCRRISGHINYFGVNGNLASLGRSGPAGLAFVGANAL